jgi:hypothetical protein
MYMLPTYYVHIPYVPTFYTYGYLISYFIINNYLETI